MMLYFKFSPLFNFKIWHVTQNSNDDKYAARLPEDVYEAMDEIYFQLVVDSHSRKLFDEKDDWETFWYSEEFLNKLINTTVKL